jgi:hypothetical protein
MSALAALRWLSLRHSGVRRRTTLLVYPDMLTKARMCSWCERARCATRSSLSNCDYCCEIARIASRVRAPVRGVDHSARVHAAERLCSPHEGLATWRSVLHDVVRFCAVRALGVRVKRCAVVLGTMRSRPSRDCSPRMLSATWSACCCMMALNAARPWSPLHGYELCITVFVGVRSTRRDIFVVGLRSWC